MRAKFESKLSMQAGGKKAAFKVRYRCSKGDARWVSAKETATGEMDAELKEDGSSEIAATWLQSHRTEFTCDDTSRTARFRIDKVEDGSKGKLVDGAAWVQFCVTSGGRNLILSKSGWVDVARPYSQAGLRSSARETEGQAVQPGGVLQGPIRGPNFHTSQHHSGQLGPLEQALPLLHGRRIHG